MPIYKKVNKNFFKKWSSEMAYVLGFFMADGSVDVNPRGSHYLSIQICDKELLENIRDVLGSNHKISSKRGLKNESDRYRLQIGSREICDDLRGLGVSEQKAHTMSIPDVPRKYFSDFVRGYFDGDGHVWMGEIHKNRKTKHLTLQTGFTSCSFNFLNDLKKYLENFGIKEGSLYSQKNYFRLNFSMKNSLLLHKIMYNSIENKLFLERKKIIFEKFIKMRS